MLLTDERIRELRNAFLNNPYNKEVWDRNDNWHEILVIHFVKYVVNMETEVYTE
jgi:hypothetical protein